MSHNGATLPESALAMPAPAPDRWTTWDRFLERTPATGFMQSSWWAEFRLAAGYEHFGIVLKDRAAIIGGAVVMKFTRDADSSFYYIPEGPVLPDDEDAAREVFEATLAAIDERRCNEEETVSHLRIEPRTERLPSFVRGFEPVPSFMDAFMEPRDTLCIDLQPTEEELLARMKPKGRYNVRLAQRHGVTIVEDTSSQAVEDFIDVYRHTMARQGLRPKPLDYFETLVYLLTSLNHGSMYFAEYRGVRLAAAIVVYFGARATYLFGGSSVQHREVMAPYLLHFEIMRRAKAAGCALYDLWGVAPPGAERHPWRDISTFKRKFGGRDVGLVPTLDYVYDAAAYARYVAEEADPGAAPAGRARSPVAADASRSVTH